MTAATAARELEWLLAARYVRKEPIQGLEFIFVSSEPRLNAG